MTLFDHIHFSFQNHIPLSFSFSFFVLSHLEGMTRKKNMEIHQIFCAFLVPVAAVVIELATFPDSTVGAVVTKINSFQTSQALIYIYFQTDRFHASHTS